MADIEAEIEKLLPCQRPDDPCAADEADFRKCHECYRRPAVAEFCRKLVADQHDENCDTREMMIQGKPCNCYVILRARVAELEQELGVGRELVAAQLKAIEIVESQLTAERQSVMNLTDRLAKLQASETGLQNQLAAERASRELQWPFVSFPVEDSHYWVIAAGDELKIEFCRWCGRHKIEVKDWDEAPECDALVAIRAQTESERKEGEKSQE